MMKTENASARRDLSRSRTSYFNPVCPACGASHTLTEYADALQDNGWPISSACRIMDVSTGTYEALKRKEGAFDAIYVGGEITPTAVGITAPGSLNGTEWTVLDIQKVTYRCTQCGKEWHSPYDLASDLAEANLNIWKRKDNKNGK